MATISATVPTHIASDVSNNLSYWLYPSYDLSGTTYVLTSKTVAQFKSLAKLNNFDFVTDINTSLLDDNRNNIINDVSYIAGSTQKIFLNYGGVVKKLFVGDNSGATSAELYINDGSSSTPFSGSNNPNTYENAGMSELAEYAILIKIDNDKIDKFSLLDKQMRNNITMSENQHTALQYIYVFLIIISILSLIFNFDSLNISHIVFFLFFVGYGFVYQEISLFIISQFKSVMKSIKTADYTTQFLHYIKIVLLTLLALFIPLSTLTKFGAYDVPLTDVTDYTQSITEDAVQYGNEFAEGARDTFNNGADAISNVVDGVRDNVQTTIENVGDRISDIKNSASDMTDRFVSRPTAPSAVEER